MNWSEAHAGRRLLSWGVTLGLYATALVTRAGDWPQYRGPTHDGVSPDRLLKEWSGSVTHPVWRVPTPNSLSSLVVSRGRVFTQIRRNLGGMEKEVCLALSATNGAELWATPVDDAIYPNGGVGPDDGPRSTPTADGSSVYVLTSYLKLCCLNATNGAVLWSTNLLTAYGGSVIGWQNAASPLLENGLLYVNVNCGSSTLVALRASDGTPAWRSQDEAMTHSTPTLATLLGVRQLIFATQSGLVSLNPQTGGLLWRFNYPFTYSTSLSQSPVVCDDLVYACGAQGYGMGSFVVQISVASGVWTASQLWANTGFGSTLAAHWMTPVAHQGFLYGQFGVTSTYDSPNAQLKCVEMRTGNVMWSTNGFGRGGTILVDDHLVALTENGQLVLVRPNTNAYTELGRCAVLTNYSSSNNRCWNAPAAADGRVYARSTGYGACFDFSVPDLKLDPPQLAPANTLELRVRTANGAPVNSNRIAGMEVRATTNTSLGLQQWVKLTNTLVLTNGLVRLTNVDAGPPCQFFIVSEPK